MHDASTRKDAVRAPLALALLLLTTLGVYANALAVPFLWDDRALVLDAGPTRDGQPLLRYFTRPFWPDPDQPRSFFRPLVALSYRLDHLLYGENATGFHVTNLALHALDVALVYALARRLGARSRAALAGAAGFALFPRLTEAVTWISGRTDVLATGFVLAALLTWPLAGERRPLLRAIAASALLSCGLLCKEVAVAGAVGIATLELVTPGAVVARARARLGPLAVGVIAPLAWRAHVLSGSATFDGLRGPGDRAAAALASWGTYAWMLVWPFHPSLQIGRVDDAPTIAIVGGLLALAAWAWLFGRACARRDGAIAALVALAGVSLALVAHLVPIPVNVLTADRFLYLPVAALAVALAAASRAPTRLPWPIAVAASAWLLACGASVVSRDDALSDELGLWVATAEGTDPENVVPALALGEALFRAGAWRDAARLDASVRALIAREGREGSVLDLDALGTEASSLAQAGDYDAALRDRRLLVALRPSSARAWLDLARVDMHVLAFAEAREALARASACGEGADAKALAARVAELGPSPPQEGAPGDAALLARARYDASLGRRSEAERAWRDLLARATLAPDDALSGAAFLVEHGSLEAAELAGSRVRAQPELSAARAAVESALEERRRVAARLDHLRPRIEALVRRLDAAGPPPR